MWGRTSSQHDQVSPEWRWSLSVNSSSSQVSQLRATLYFVSPLDNCSVWVYRCNSEVYLNNRSVIIKGTLGIFGQICKYQCICHSVPVHYGGTKPFWFFFFFIQLQFYYEYPWGMKQLQQNIWTSPLPTFMLLKWIRIKLGFKNEVWVQSTRAESPNVPFWHFLVPSVPFKIAQVPNHIFHLYVSISAQKYPSWVSLG